MTVDVELPPRVLADIADQYRRARPVAHCVCGGSIVGDYGNSAEAVRRHQATASHRNWWARSGWPASEG